MKTKTDILNSQQLEAIKYGAGPLLIIAGAGTGKTTVITERIKYLILSQKVNPQEILALTFTEKASREMEERIDLVLPYGLTQMWISTFHAFCDRVLRSDGIHIGLNPVFRLMTEAETILFFRKHLFLFDLKYFRPLGNPVKFISGMLNHFDRLRDEDIVPKEYLNWVNSNFKASDSKLKEISKNQTKKLNTLDTSDNIFEIQKDQYLELANAYQKYQEIKQKEGLMDYADLISNTLMLFRKRPNILTRYQKQFKYILIDEFQDTNYAQNELAILLSQKYKNITVVGDDDQAIYRFRGAAISNIIQFRSRFPAVKTIVLTQNYRSTQEILNRSYDLISFNNPDRLEVKEGIDKKLISARKIKGEKVKFIYTNRVENEAEEVVKEIKKLVTEEERSFGERFRWKDIAILVRANIHIEPFVRSLVRLGVPYQFLGPGQLFRQPEVKDLIAYLKVLYNFEDNVAMYRVITMEYLNILPRDIAVISNYAKKQGFSIFESCESIDNLFVSKDTKQHINMLVQMIHRHLGLIKSETAGQILYYFLQDTGILSNLVQYKTPKDEIISKNIAKLFDRLKTYEAEHDDSSVFAVVDWIDLSMELGESPRAGDMDWTENNAVNILTVHSAKGLEFPIVFLVNLVSQRFPTREKKEQIPIPEELIKELLPEGDYHLEEERRLFYVGMTRAKDRLYFTAANYYGEGKREKKLSPYIIEAIGEKNVQAVQTTKQSSQQLLLSGWDKIAEQKGHTSPIQSLKTVNYSQIETFQTCPLQYKYRFIIRIPVPPSAALNFGSIIHETVKSFYLLVKEGQKPSKKMLLDLLDKNWKSIGFGKKIYEMKMKAHGKELLNDFFNKGFDPKIIPLDLEKSFAIKLTQTLRLTGRIDRVDKTGNILEIIDYKTGSAPKNKDVKKDIQLSVYALAAIDKGIYAKKPEEVIVSFYYFEGNSKVSAKRSSAELDKAKESIIQTVKDIEASNYHPKVGKHCDFCEFRLICEAWN